MKVQYSNNAATTLSAPVEAGHEILIVASASAFPILTGSDWMYVTVEEEVVKVTNTSGNVFTCSAFSQAHGTGGSVQGRITKNVMEDASDADVYSTASNKPADGTMREGEIFANHTDKQIGVGDASGNPVNMVAIRFHSTNAKYYVGDMVTYGDGVWRCLLEHTGSGFTESMWEVVGGAGGGIVYEPSASGDLVAEAGNGYFVYTDSAVRQVTLPAGVVGETVGINDISNNCGTNNITIISNGSEKIMGLVENFLMDINGSTVVFSYADSTTGWAVTGGTW